MNIMNYSKLVRRNYFMSRKPSGSCAFALCHEMKRIFVVVIVVVVVAILALLVSSLFLMYNTRGEKI